MSTKTSHGRNRYTDPLHNGEYAYKRATTHVCYSTYLQFRTHKHTSSTYIKFNQAIFETRAAYLSLNLFQMSTWNQLYDLEPLLHTPPTEPTSKQQHSYITCKPYRRYDSDTSSISSAEGIEDFDSPTWWDILDHEEEAITRYKKFLREQLAKGQSLKKQEEPEVMMRRVQGTLTVAWVQKNKY